MVVNIEKRPIDSVRVLVRKQNNLLLASDLAALQIPRTYLSILEKKGEIQRISRGIYIAADSLADEMVCIQARYQNAIFSHETALYLLGLSDQTPLAYSVTVPSVYNASSLKANRIKVFFVKSDLHLLGSITVNSSFGNNIKTYNPERTICDILRNRSRIDTQIVNEAMKRYAAHPERNIDSLYRYAKEFGIQNIARRYMEILL